MRKHGWQLPYHPLQVVAMAVLLALGFAFYVFFLPFVGKKLFQYVVMGLYTPLVTSVFCLYVWCIATDPADSGVFKSNKYLDLDDVKQTHPKVMRQGRQSFYAVTESQAKTTGDKPLAEGICIDGIGENLSDRFNGVNTSSHSVPCLVVLFGWCPLSFLCNQHHSHGQSSEQQVSEDGMLYCSLCKVEVFKYSKHCRVCDKCIDGFDHHCRWLNNCIGRKNYRRFFVLMVSALLLLILQWSMGVLVLILCFIKRKQFSVEIIAKLGSSFSLLPFVVVVASCTILAMVTTIPLTQLFFFHVLLIKKGISTYDYIIALREQVQQASGAQQSPQMSPVSSLTGLSSASSFSAVQHGAWCTPPHSFLEDQFDVVPPESGTYINPLGKRMMTGNSSRKRRTTPVTINPWTLAQLNAEVSKVAAQAKKKSRILQPVGRQEIPMGRETDISSCGSGQMTLRLDNRRRAYKRGRLHVGRSLEPLAKVSTGATDCKSGDLDPEASISLPPLQLEARSAFRTRQAMSATIATSSPDSSISSDLHPSRVSSFGAEEARGITSLPFAVSAAHKGTRLLRSTSDGYEASGGEDSDQVPSRIIHRSSNWTNLLFDSSHGGMAGGLKGTILGRPANLS